MVHNIFLQGLLFVHPSCISMCLEDTGMQYYQPPQCDVTGATCRVPLDQSAIILQDDMMTRAQISTQRRILCVWCNGQDIPGDDSRLTRDMPWEQKVTIRYVMTPGPGRHC